MQTPPVLQTGELPRATSHQHAGPSHSRWRRDHLSLSAQRWEFIGDANHYIYECSVPCWFAKATSVSFQDDVTAGQRFSLDHAKRINDDLLARRKDILTAKGFIELSRLLNKKGVTENVAIERVENIASAVNSSAKALYPTFYNNETQTATFHHTGTRTAYSDVPGRIPKPDARMILKQMPDQALRRSERENIKQPPPSAIAADSAANFEFKTGLDMAGRMDNELKLVGGANYSLYNDPRRTHTYGITMEGTMTTFWRFDRGLMLISERFDCQEKPEWLIMILLFLAFATEEELGFDTTVERVLLSTRGMQPGSSRAATDSKMEPFFVYTMAGRRYRTIGSPIAEDGAFSMTSRGVRLWLVKEVDSNNEFLPQSKNHVLKDGWYWSEKPFESATQHHILEKLRKLDMVDNGTRERKMSDFFVTIKHEEIVFLASGIPGMTLERPEAAVFRGKLTAPVHDNKLSQKRVQRTPGYYMPEGQSSAHKGFQSAQRTHRRLLVEDYCETLLDCSSMTVLLSVGKQLCEGLNLLREAGYVHRDISCGNCLIHYHAHGHQAKLSDLEYCQEYESIPSNDPITGTYEFMATEACTQSFAFTPNQLQPANLRQPTYHYHPLHDLESLFWVFLYLIFSRMPKSCNHDLDPSHTVDYQHRQFEFHRLFADIPRDDAATDRKLLFLLRPHSTYTLTWCPLLKAAGWEGTHPFEPIIDMASEWEPTFTALQALPQDSANLRWGPDCFTDKLYNRISQAFEDMISGIAPHQAEICSFADYLKQGGPARKT